MRQRNDQDHPLLVHTDPPQLVEPGGEVDHDIPVIGLTVLDDPEPAPEPAPSKATKPAPAAPEVTP